MPITVQQSLERFVHQHYDSNREAGQLAESCANLLADYLQFWSGLFHADVAEADIEPAEWERDLDEKMTQMLHGDNEPPAVDLGSLTMERFDAEYLREFVGWYLLKDMAFDSLMLQGVLEMLEKWIGFALRQQGMTAEQHRELIATLHEVAPEAKRVTVAAHALQKLVVSGTLDTRSVANPSPIKALVSATARISMAEPGDGCSHWLSVDEVGAERLPVTLPEGLRAYLQQGDVLQLCLACHADGGMRIVESGALFPASTWVDAVLMERYNPSDAVAEQAWEPLPDGVLH